jgi:hypothetical protein
MNKRELEAFGKEVVDTQSSFDDIYKEWGASPQ